MDNFRFRAWDRFHERWATPEHLSDSEHLTVENTDMGFRFLDDSESGFDFIQFTGLKDKEKKEIYIGDIIKWSDDGIIVICEKDELGFYYDMVKSFDENVCMHDIRFYRSEDEADIVGNIYENPKMKNKSYWTKKKIDAVYTTDETGGKNGNK